MPPHQSPSRRVGDPCRVAGALLLLGAAATLGGCFYLTAINERPRGRIEEKTTGPYHVGDEAVFSATGSTDDSDRSDLSVGWQAFSCPTDGSGCVASGPQQILGSTASDFVVAVTTKGTLRVELELIDRQGALEKTTVELPVVNRAPQAQVAITREFPDPGDLGGHVLGLPIYIAVNASDLDGDEIVIEWDADAPIGAGSNPDNVTFEPVAGRPDVHQLIGDVAGVWTVSVTASDGDGGEGLASTQIVFAPDSPPCLTGLSPALAPDAAVFVSAAPRRFAVLFAQDGLDPYPAIVDAHELVGRARFSWSLATPATGNILEPMPGHDLAEVVIDPTIHAPGDHLTLRVEVSDRLNLPVACPIGEPTCSGSANACSQRMTWEIEIR